MGFVDFLFIYYFFFLNLCMGSKFVTCWTLFGMEFVRFFFIYYFFPEFVYGLSHVRLYLGWDLSDFIFIFF
jgi:hypothetical protein